MTDGPGEFELVHQLAEVFGPPRDGLGIGDDAAAWTPSAGNLQVATTDMLVEGVHFRLDWTSVADLGWKALAVNLSDLAAMGARPGRALVSVAIDPERRDLVVGLARGMRRLADRTGTQVMGGDTVRSPGPFVVNVTLVGEADPARLLRRDAARPGDLLAVTGRLGRSAAGLDLLLAGRVGPDGSLMRPDAELAGADTGRNDAMGLLAAHHRPWPRVVAGQILGGAGVRCAIDISDGLASEAGHLADASGVGIEVDLDRVPLEPAARRLMGEDRCLELALTGGEDYEVLFTMPPELERSLVLDLAEDGGLTVIGRVVEGADRAGNKGAVRLVRGGRQVTFERPGYVAF